MEYIVNNKVYNKVPFDNFIFFKTFRNFSKFIFEKNPTFQKKIRKFKKNSKDY